MKMTRRAALATTASTLLAGCSVPGGRETRVNWSTRLHGEYITQRPGAGEDSIAVATSDGNLCILDSATGDPAGDGCTNEFRYHVAGTPPTSIDYGYLTVTDRVITTDHAGRVIWSDPLPHSDYAKTHLRPIKYNGDVYLLSNDSSLVRIDSDSQQIRRVGELVLNGVSWDSKDGQAVVGTRSRRTEIVDLETGNVQWSEDANMEPEPCWYETDIVTQAYDREDESIHVVRISPEDETVRWDTAVPGVFASCSELVGDTALAIATQLPDSTEKPHIVSFLDIETGKIIESYELEYLSWGFRGGTTHNDRLYLTGNLGFNRGEVTAISPDDGTETVIELDRSIESPPTVQDGSLVFGTNDAFVYSVAMD